MIDHTKLFKKVTDFIITVILYILLLTLVIGMLRILLDIPSVVTKSLGFETIFALSALLLVFGIIRVLAVRYSPENV